MTHRAIKKEVEIGFLHLDIMVLPKMSNEVLRPYLFIAIDRSSRWIHLEVFKVKSGRSAGEFLNRLVSKAPFKIHKVLTDNDRIYTDGRFNTAEEQRPGSKHLFSKTCLMHHIEHRLVLHESPLLKGLAERFLVRLERNLLTARIDKVEEMVIALNQYCAHYHNVPQAELGCKAPVDILKGLKASSNK